MVTTMFKDAYAIIKLRKDGTFVKVLRVVMHKEIADEIVRYIPVHREYKFVVRKTRVLVENWRE